MEKETEKSAVILKEDANVGSVQIADDVVAMIASLAATEVDGVSAMAGMKKRTKGVRVEVRDNAVKVALALTMDYGYNIPATCQQVQTKVKNAIENMTGLSCTDVNIRIAGVSMKKDK